jgi:hypothetical protein
VAITLLLILTLTPLGWIQWRQVRVLDDMSHNQVDAIMWQAYQLERELSRLDQALHKAQRQPQTTDPWALVERYEVFLSRIDLLTKIPRRDLLQNSPSFAAAQSQLELFTHTADPLFAEAAAKYGFESGKSTHADRLATIRDNFERHGVTIDTHTADGVKVAREHHQDANVPMIVLETALPIKFAETIIEALGHAPERPAKFDGIEALPKRVQVMPADVDLVKAYIERHCAPAAAG